MSRILLAAALALSAAIAAAASVGAAVSDGTSNTIMVAEAVHHHPGFMDYTDDALIEPDGTYWLR